MDEKRFKKTAGIVMMLIVAFYSQIYFEKALAVKNILGQLFIFGISICILFPIIYYLVLDEEDKKK